MTFALAAAATFAGMFLHASSFAPSGKRVARSPIRPDTALSMRVETSGDSLVVSWKRQMGAAKSARSGILSINDGSNYRDINLPQSEIASGSILYKPSSHDVTFRLQTHDGERTPLTSMVRVFDATFVSSAGVTAATLRSTPPKISRPSLENKERHEMKSAIQSPSPQPRSHSMASTQIAQKESLPVIPFNTGQNPEPLTASLVSTRAPEFVPAPRQNPASSTEPIEGRHQTEQERAADAKTPAATSASQKTIATVSSPQSSLHQPVASPLSKSHDGTASSIYVPPRPVKQVIPNTRMFGSSAVSVPMKVEVTVQIDETGRVVNAFVVKTQTNAIGPLLTVQSIAAAKQWLFEPAKMHGKNVRSEYLIQFSFRPRPF